MENSTNNEPEPQKLPTEAQAIAEYKKSVSSNPLLAKYGLKLCNKNNFLFFKVISVLFLFIVLCIAGAWGFFVYTDELSTSSFFNATQICSAVTCPQQTCSPTLTCPTIPANNCPDLNVNCRCYNGTG